MVDANSYMNPLISILFPVYGTADYLREAMDSILNQTFSDFELIVLNDCSPDNAEEILDTYTDSRIIRYHGDYNQGLSNVLNVGISMARGKYIARMDSDDISHPERLQIQFDYLEAHPEVDLCSTGMHLFGARDEIWLRPSDPDAVKVLALFHSPVLHASSVWRKSSFEEYGLRFRQEMVPAEDYDLWCRALTVGLRMTNIPDILYEYRIHAWQATSNTSKSKEKISIIRKEYFRQAFPNASEDAANMFKDWDTCSMRQLRRLLFGMLAENCMRPFFNSRILAKRLVKFYSYRMKSR